MTDRKLDRIYRQDLRSLGFLVNSALKADNPQAVYRPRSYTWGLDLRLDQGSEGACVGFAFAHELAAVPQVVEKVNAISALAIYHAAQRVDDWEGGAYPGANPFYEGTSVLAGAKICTNYGFYHSYTWGLTATEVARGVAYFGPTVLGVNWYEGMFHPNADGFIKPEGQLAGGHAILAVAVKIVYKCPILWWRREWKDVNMDKSYLVLNNSWGPSWGANGRAKLSLSDLERLLSEDGEACFPVRTSKTT
jgi:hypothetical protein